MEKNTSLTGKAYADGSDESVISDRKHHLLKKYFLLLLIIPGFGLPVMRAQSLVIDHHSIAAFDSIPEMYKVAAAQMRLLFMDRSVGFNISAYLDCLASPFASASAYCKKYEHMDSLYAVDPAEVHWSGTWDRSHWQYEAWPDGCSEDVQCFIDFITPQLDSFEVIGCQFSYLAVLPGAMIANPVSGFFGQQGNNNKASTYAAFAAAHAGKKLIWWTTSLARGIGTPESESFNEQMRAYAAAHDIILFDVADIESHAPDGMPCFDNRDGVPYKDENNPDDGLTIPAICPQYTTETEGGHLGAISAGGIRISKAMWVLMARLAGWTGLVTRVMEPVKPHFRLFPNPATDKITLETDLSATIGEYLIFDLHGRLKMRNDFQIQAKGNTYIGISLHNFNPGMYFVQIRHQGLWENHKMIVY